MKMHECPHVDCNATMRGKREYDEHFKTYPKPFRYQCKHPDCGKEFHQSSLFFQHKKFCQHKSKSQTEDNPQLKHSLADTRNHHIAGQSSVGQQDRSSDECPLVRLNVFDDADGSIFDGPNIPGDVVVNVENINMDDGNIFTRNH
ncbi:hypothetical protein LOAG_12782 [Loa loa]|uniref:C2H2-type domain-containing protein n=1 Tax=Loa loa TaxID=7209 RepID=A0A1S0TL52_LOALO|nr:hypothetical protein LOAG_12782 [Loa loa]EFO15725.1 hypothetical protein LOAG_12782 [Loa loa]